jgi:hypothetical protein
MVPSIEFICQILREKIGVCQFSSSCSEVVFKILKIVLSSAGVDLQMFRLATLPLTDIFCDMGKQSQFPVSACFAKISTPGKVEV